MTLRRSVNTNEELRHKLIVIGAERCREFGYAFCTSDNLMKDYCCRAVFKSILEDEENINISRDVEKVRLELIAEIDKLQAKGIGE